MALRTSNQVAHIPSRSISLTNTAASTLKKKDAHGVVSDDNIASLLSISAISVSAYYWHEASQQYVLAGYGAAVYQVAFEALGTYAWTIPKGAYVLFVANGAGPYTAYTDLDKLPANMLPFS